MKVSSDFINRTEDGTCTCRNPNCPTHDLVSDGLMRPVPCREGEIIVCGYCANEAVKRGPCIHLGEPTGDKRECVTCNGKVMIKLRKCAVHKVCTTHKPIGWQCCASCLDKEYA
jgi:hypothetical protein